MTRSQHTAQTISQRLRPNLSAKEHAEATAMLVAYEEGAEWAQSLKVGDRFLGSMGEARARGLEGKCASMFSTAAFNTLKAFSGVWVDDKTNLIIKLNK